MFNVLIAVLALALSGCAAGGGRDWSEPMEAPTAVPAVVEPAPFGADETTVHTWRAADATANVFEAADLWYEATGLEVGFADEGSPITYMAWADLQGPICTEGAHGCIQRDGTITYRDDWKDTWRELTGMVHEFGHWMLFPTAVPEHHDVPGIMHQWWPEEGYEPTISADLIEAVCAVRPCKWQRPTSIRTKDAAP